jgi:hypothetical protein
LTDLAKPERKEERWGRNYGKEEPADNDSSNGPETRMQPYKWWESPTATDQCNHAKEIGVVKNVLRNGNGSKAEV